ncbi:MAG: hypothetical protein HOO06_09960 [Bdellovibrionaceae bacterium]|nr:hypothetical protein [Pseudobdellovibrionaceae bacterium]
MNILVVSPLKKELKIVMQTLGLFDELIYRCLSNGCPVWEHPGKKIVFTYLGVGQSEFQKNFKNMLGTLESLEQVICVGSCGALNNETQLAEVFTFGHKAISETNYVSVEEQKDTVTSDSSPTSKSLFSLNSNEPGPEKSAAGSVKLAKSYVRSDVGPIEESERIALLAEGYVCVTQEGFLGEGYAGGVALLEIRGVTDYSDSAFQADFHLNLEQALMSCAKVLGQILKIHID